MAVIVIAGLALIASDIVLDAHLLVAAQLPPKTAADRRAAVGQRTNARRDESGRDEKGTAAPATGNSGRKSDITSSELVVEVLAGSGVGIRAQRWAEIFAELKIDITIAPAGLTAEPASSESRRGPVRIVKLVGVLDRSGQLRFQNATFRESQRAELAKYLEELRLYGVQGNPEGQPAWGLSPDQFRELFATFAKPLEADVSGLSIDEAIAAFPFGDTIKVDITTEARQAITAAGVRASVKQRVRGLSLGTAFAAVLNDYGLAFRPRRLPSGRIDLVVVPYNPDQKLWPIGWQSPKPGPDLLPEIFKFTAVDLDNVELAGVLDTVAGLTEIILVTDEPVLREKKIDLATIKVSHAPKRTTWSSALRTVLAQGKCRFEVVIDEANRGFVWVTAAAVYRRPPVETLVDESLLAPKTPAPKLPSEKTDGKNPPQRKRPVRPAEPDDFGGEP